MNCLKPTYELKSKLNYEKIRLSDNYYYCIKALEREICVYYVIFYYQTVEMYGNLKLLSHRYIKLKSIWTQAQIGQTGQVIL